MFHFSKLLSCFRLENTGNITSSDSKVICWKVKCSRLLYCKCSLVRNNHEIFSLDVAKTPNKYSRNNRLVKRTRSYISYISYFYFSVFIYYFQAATFRPTRKVLVFFSLHFFGGRNSGPLRYFNMYSLQIYIYPPLYLLYINKI